MCLQSLFHRVAREQLGVPPLAAFHASIPFVDSIKSSTCSVYNKGGADICSTSVTNVAVWKLYCWESRNFTALTLSERFISDSGSSSVFVKTIIQI